MSFFSRVSALCCAVVMFFSAGLVHAEQYRYQDEQGNFVVSSEKPDAGVSYAVLDDEGVYQYLVHATAAVSPSVDWPADANAASPNKQESAAAVSEQWLQLSGRQEQ